MKKRVDIDGLLNILETGDVKACREAICFLGELRHRKAIRPLLGMLETDDIQIRANSAWALGEIGDDRAVLPLIGLLNDPTENVRIHAAWSLGRIGDKRAIPGLKAAMKSGSSDMRKHAKEAISRIESNGNDTGQDHDLESNGVTFSNSIDFPLVTLNVPQDLFECDYKSMVESNNDNGKTQISKDVLIKDKFLRDNKRNIVLGLKNEFNGLVSVDVILKYVDNYGNTKRVSSVWLQMSSTGEIEVRPASSSTFNIEPVQDDLESEEMVETVGRESGRKRARISRKSRHVEYDRDEEPEIRKRRITPDVIDDEYPVVKRKEITRYDNEYQPDVEPVVKKSGSRTRRFEPEVEPVKEAAAPLVSEEPEIRTTHIEPEVEPVRETMAPVEPKEPEIGTSHIEPDIEPVRETVAPVEPEEPELKTGHVEPEIQPLKETIEPEKEKPIAPPHDALKAEPPKQVNVDSAVQLLSHIGMSGMTNAASTVTQLSGQEAESLQSQLRTLPVDQMHGEITNLGESIVLIGVELHGKGQTGEVKGEMQLYISKENALSVANELLCNPPDAAVGEFTEDITSTLKETANIFGGQYISAISEYIEVPLLLKAPSFKTGASSQIVDSVVENIKGKVEFVLSTDLPLGANKSGRLIMLLDPASFDIIIQKLF